MQRQSLLAIACCVVFGLALLCTASYAAGKVGYINLQRLVNESRMGQTARREMQELRKQKEAVVANKVLAKEDGKVTTAGKFCESGDILIRDVNLPEVSAGDIIAVADCGAYCLPLSSNYNAAFRPAVAMVREGKARLIRRRETLEDLTRCDLV